MKREHPEMRNLAESGGSSAGLKAKIWEEEQGDGAMDELLAVLGYKVKQSDMADVAQKLEQLEMAMCRGSIDQNNQDGLLSYLSDTVHYNPSDISGWLESMLSEINPNPNFDPNPNPASSSSSVSAGQIDQAPNRVDPNPTHNSSTSLGIYEDNSEYDLRAIPGPAVAYPNKRIKSAPPVSGAAPPPEQPARPLLLVDSQETGVRLVHTLMACAEAVQNNNLKLADALVKQVGLLAVSQQGAMRKVATYFAEALARRIYRIYPNHLYSAVDSDILYMHFYESCPYLKFAHFTANQAILEAVSGSNRIHIIDFSMKQGLQWPALMQAFALQPGVRPAFRLTGIGPPQADNTDALQEVGWKLAQFAELLGIQFEYKGFVCDSLADLEPTMLDLRPSEVETLAVNSMFELHRLLARPGAAETVLRRIKAMQPKIVTLVEQEANHNGPVFLDRFNEALHYYSTMFDSLEGGSTQTGGSGSQQDVVMSEVFLGRQICNVVACEGADRVERHETVVQWRARMDSAGFDPVHLGSNAFKQASTLLERFAGRDGYRVEENNGCLMLDWHTRPLIATSAWRPAPATSK